MTHIEMAQTLRDNEDVHYNCCQAVVLAYAADAGMTQAQASAMSAHFGSGMRMGSVCGAVTGGLMALGLLGRGEAEVKAFTKRFRAEAGNINCADLLRAAHENGEEKKTRCDRMVALAVGLVEEVGQP